MPGPGLDRVLRASEDAQLLSVRQSAAVIASKCLGELLILSADGDEGPGGSTGAERGDH